MTTMYFDTRYNVILFTNANLFMNDILTCQLIGMGVTTKSYDITWNTGTHSCVKTMKTQRKENHDNSY